MPITVDIRHSRAPALPKMEEKATIKDKAHFIDPITEFPYYLFRSFYVFLFDRSKVKSLVSNPVFVVTLRIPTFVHKALTNGNN